MIAPESAQNIYLLCVKLWNMNNNTLYTNTDLLDEIKKNITSKIHGETMLVNNEETEYVIRWRLEKIIRPYNSLFAGDIITHSVYNDDLIVHKHTEKLLYKIQKDCKNNNKYQYDFDWRIIFHIVKPITSNDPLAVFIENEA